MSEQITERGLKGANRQESVRLIHIEAFLFAVESGSLAGAGRILEVDRKTVDTYLKALEEWLGTELLVKSKRKATMTADGEIFFLDALEIVNRLHANRRNFGRKDKHIDPDMVREYSENAMRQYYAQKFGKPDD